MKIRYVFVALFITGMLLLAGCTGDNKERGFFGGKEESGTQPFVIGTNGLLGEFTLQRPPDVHFAGGDDSFDVEIELKNDGGYTVPKDKMVVVLTGIDPEEFSKTQQDFIKSPEADLERRYFDPEGNEVDSLPQYVLFENLNHVDPLIGVHEFPLRAEFCYRYGTYGLSELCYKEDQRLEGGVCEVNELREISSSSAPIVLSDNQQTAISKDAFAFSFKLEHKGNGQIYLRDECSGRNNEDKVYVVVNTGSAGLSCSGLRNGQADNEGYADLRGGEAIVRCRQDVREDIRGAFIKPVDIELIYNYKEAITTQISVQSES